MLLQVEGLTYSYSEKEAISNVSLQVDKGEFDHISVFLILKSVLITYPFCRSKGGQMAT